MNPWEDQHSIWKTQSAYFSWLRGGLRRMWARHPMSIKFKNSKCRPARPHDPISARVKSVGECARCNKIFAKSHLEVDHMIPVGSLQSWDDVGPFVKRLLGCSSEHLRLVCKSCHGIITAAERFQCSEDEAKLRKTLILFKCMSAAQQKTMLKSLRLPLGQNAKERQTIYYTSLQQHDA